MKNTPPVGGVNCVSAIKTNQDWESRLEGMEAMLEQIHQILAKQTPKKDWYTIREVAQTLERSEFTVREWARLNRIFASKRACGRGNSQEWIVSAEELQRIKNEGLLPIDRRFQ